nr:MAG TPA: hypothetical protein [Caudoviricetes sp.]
MSSSFSVALSSILLISSNSSILSIFPDFSILSQIPRSFFVHISILHQM